MTDIRLSLRQQAIRELCNKHYQEYLSLKAANLEYIKALILGKSNEYYRTWSRNTSESRLLEKHYQEYKDIHNRIKLENGIDDTLEAITRFASEPHTSKEADRFIVRLSLSKARTYLKIKYKMEYDASIQEAIGYLHLKKDSSKVITLAYSLLKEKHQEEFDKELREQKFRLSELYREVSRYASINSGVAVE